MKLQSKFVSFALAVCVGIGFVGCGSGKSPIEVETYIEDVGFGQYLSQTFYVRVTAVVDSVTIKRVVVNRGNCGDSEVERTLSFGEAYKERIGGRIVNMAIPPNGCSINSVKEVQVFTDKGDWTFNF